MAELGHMFLQKNVTERTYLCLDTAASTCATDPALPKQFGSLRLDFAVLSSVGHCLVYPILEALLTANVVIEHLRFEYFSEVTCNMN